MKPNYIIGGKALTCGVDEGHEFVCKKCGMNYNDRIKELGDEGLQKLLDKIKEGI